MPAPPHLDEFREMVRRNLGAASVRIVDDVPDQPAAGSLHCALPGGGYLEVSFDAPAPDRTAMIERLETLVSSFTTLLEGAPAASEHAPAGASLHEQVVALAERSDAIDVVIIDAHSPVVWDSLGGSFVVAEEGDDEPVPDNVRRIDDAGGRPRGVPPDLLARARVLGVQVAVSLVMDPRLIGLVPNAVCKRYGLVPLRVADGRLLVAMSDPSDLEAVGEVVLAAGIEVEPVFVERRLVDRALRWKRRAAAAASPAAGTPATADAERRHWERHFASHKAIELVRRRQEMPALHKGGHLVFDASAEGFGCIARSFAGIYVLILVFAGAYDEIKAKHAIARALPVIERLVLALPPTEPPPQTHGAIAARARMPRRR